MESKTVGEDAFSSARGQRARRWDEEQHSRMKEPQVTERETISSSCDIARSNVDGGRSVVGDLRAGVKCGKGL